MNNRELKARLLTFSQRADLSGVAQDFINMTSQRINNRISGLELGDMFDDTDSNVVSANHDVLYHFGGMRELFLYIHDIPSAVSYDDLFDKECARINIHNSQDSWVTDVTELDHIRTEAETAALTTE